MCAAAGQAGSTVAGAQGGFTGAAAAANSPAGLRQGALVLPHDVQQEEGGQLGAALAPLSAQARKVERVGAEAVPVHLRGRRWGGGSGGRDGGMQGHMGAGASPPSLPGIQTPAPSLSQLLRSAVPTADITAPAAALVPAGPTHTPGLRMWAPGTG